MAGIHKRVESSKAFPRAVLLRIDGSAVTTSAAATGLDEGSADANVSKGSGGTSNEVTLAFTKAFTTTPVVVAQSITTNCKVELKSVSTTGCVLETFQVADGTTGVDDADMHVVIIGWD
jgi:hypothetical protein